MATIPAATHPWRFNYVMRVTRDTARNWGTSLHDLPLGEDPPLTVHWKGAEYERIDHDTEDAWYASVDLYQYSRPS